jgi:uncharacterized protein YggT (Ycf19 family)
MGVWASFSDAFLHLLRWIIQAYTFVIFVSCILSWFHVSPWGAWGNLVRLMQALTEPVYERVRRVLPAQRLYKINWNYSVLTRT